MSGLKYATLKDLIAADMREGVAFLFRHAERFPLNSMEDVITAGLTEKGHRDAFEFGKTLSRSWKIGKVFSSPIQRCIDTGAGILQGAGMHAAIQLRWWLYSPNLRIPNEPRPDGEYVRVLSDRYLLGMDKRKIGLLLHRMKYPSRRAGINLYITHDTTVLPVLAYLMGIDEVSTAQVPGYLEGIVLARQQDGVVLAA